jgi:cytochrome c553
MIGRSESGSGGLPRAARLALLMATALLLTIAGVPAAASEETVDQLTRSALALDAHPAKGRVGFRQHCAQCHGADGSGDATRTIPALAGQRFAYLVRQLASLSGDQRDSATMHRVLSTQALKGPQVWVDIAAYLNAAPAVQHAATGNGAGLELGKGIFREQCSSCHRDNASGDDDGFVPSLRAQHYPYLVNQINRLADGERHNVDEALVQFLRSFDADEIRAVADYLSRLPGRPTVHQTMRSNGVVVD